MQEYYYTYWLSGKDVNGNPITSHTSWHMTIKASTRAIADKKLKNYYYKSVVVNIDSCTVSNGAPSRQ